MTNEQLARILHETNRIFGNEFCGDHHKPWDEAEGWARQSSLIAVDFHRKNPDAPDSAIHDAWMAERLAAGWTYGPVRDVAAKKNPSLVPYAELSREQRFKDALQRAIVKAAFGDEG